MGTIQAMLLLVAMLVGMPTTSTQEPAKPRGDPLRDGERDFLWEEFPNRGDSTGDVDHTDILNFDPVTRTMLNKKPKNDVILLEECQTDLVQCRHNLADFHEKTLIDAMYDKNEDHNKVGICAKELKTCQENLADCKLGYSINMPVSPDDAMESPCKLEQMFFRRFAKRFINLLIEEYKEDDDSPLEADVRVELGSYSWNKLRQFVQQKGKVKLVDAHDLMADMLITARHDNDTGRASWLERLTGMDASNIQFYVLVVSLSIVVFVFESRTHASWWQQLCAVMFVMFLISVGWNWIYLYKKELAHKISEMQKRDNNVPGNCNPDKMTWVDSIKEVFRKQLTFQADPCDEYHKMILVDPIYEVPPTRAISHTVSILFLEPLKPLGKYIGEFHNELLKDLPYAAWIPAVLPIYLIPVFVIIMMCYCPCTRHRRMRDDIAWERVRELEDRLRKRDAIERRGERVEELENRPQEAYAAMQHAPLPVRDPAQDYRYLRDVPLARHQRQYPDNPVAERPQPRTRRRQRGSSESDLLQNRRQPFVRDLGPRAPQSTPYQGDVSAGDDSSDEMDGHRGKRPRALHLEADSGPSQVLSSAAPRVKLQSQTSDIQGQPVGCPNSEVDSIEYSSTPRNPVSPSRAQTGQMVPKGGSQGKGKRGAMREAGKEDEAKIRKEKSKSGDAGAVSASITPASSTDSEPFVASAPGFDSPSSVSVIEGDSSPASGGSMDGDTHLQGLGMSLSGSIDVIEPLGTLAGGEGDKSEDGQESDEFEVLSREQCQTENME